MSERVENMLIVLGPQAELEQFQKKAIGRMVQYSGEDLTSWEWYASRGDPTAQAICFNNFINVPSDLLAKSRWPNGKYGGNPNECGGAWEREHWGCEYGPWWSHGSVIQPGVLRYHFETVNAVAVQAFRSISAQLPALRFELFWQAEWEMYDPTHLSIFVAGELIEDRVTTINMYHLRPKLRGTAEAVEFYTDWTEFRNDVSADWLPEWADVREEIGRSFRCDKNDKQDQIE